ncbi:TPR-like protein [Eremomyces bilateralis CBS 781.70]|uniref:TPR-like protein n=1 Tax=Eremomyces bilateralis CBS 781.70 TaxID=1392243 RepID=A0A6G1FS34_9PEZI|nr:TPR-like protein [Eremomyces bilateralis CBS 781.70]KAF1808546.1 TPR-like protein [Eremomyces bilateralis CBS 781.70]
MATHQHQSPTTVMPQHHPPPQGHVQANGHPSNPAPTIIQRMAQANEAAWYQAGQLAEVLGNLDDAIQSYQEVIRHNPYSVPAMIAISHILRSRDQFPQAVDVLRSILKLEPNSGEVWGSLGHCYLMMDNLQDAYSAYQQAIYHLPDPKEPKLWYGIGILYDRYGSLEHAEDAFSQVMRMDPTFEKANEIYFRLGIIYKQQQKYPASLDCFSYIVNDPPRPLTEEDIWFQIGHVHEQQKDYEAAKSAYRRVLDRDPKHAKVLQQLGWLYHQESTDFRNQDQAIEYLEKSVAADQTDAQSWYLLGRCYMALQKYPKAYEAYQQAVYRDGRNPTFWCSIGVLYYQINQYRDALDAYSRAIRLNPNISEVWYDLGTLYESCNNQTADALDAYTRAAELDPTNHHIKARLNLLKNGGPTNGMPNQNSAPMPQDVHPNAYQPAPVQGPPAPQWNGSAATQHQAPPPPSFDNSRRLAEIQQNAQPPQQLSSFDQRDGRVQPIPPPRAAVRPPSPRPEPGRTYTDPARMQQHPPPPPPPPRNHSPSPKALNAPSLSRGPSGHQPGGPPPPPMLSAIQGPPPQPSPAAPQRITNPNYGPGSSNSSVQPSTPLAGPPFQPPNVHRDSPEVRPIVDNRPTSAGSGYHPPGFPPHPAGPTSLPQGGPPPLTTHPVEPTRDRDDRNPIGPKRYREWEDHDTKGPGPDDSKRQRMSSPPPPPPPPQPVRHSPEQPRTISPLHPKDEQDADARMHKHPLSSDAGGASSPYQPSGAAHTRYQPHPPPPPPEYSSHPATPVVRPPSATHAPLPAPPTPTHQPTPPHPAPHQVPTPLSTGSSALPPMELKEGSKPHEPEPAARRMEIDESYEDEEDGRKAGSGKGEGKGSPRE